MNKYIILLILMLMIYSCNSNAQNIGDFYDILSGSWRSEISIDFETDLKIETSWGETSVKGLSSDFIIDISDNHEQGRSSGDTDGRWHLIAPRLLVIVEIEILNDNTYKIYLKENWKKSSSDNPYLRGGNSGIVFLRFIDENRIELRVGEESDKYFLFLSQIPDSSYSSNIWIRTDGPQAEFQEGAP